MIAEILERVDLRLAEMGLSDNAASKLAGKSDLIRNMRRALEQGKDRQGVSTATLEALAPVLKTSPGWLLDGNGDESTSASVAVVGYANAGAVVVLYGEGQGPLEFVDPPPGSKSSTVAVKVDGTSLGPAFDRSYVFYDDVRSPVTPDLHNRLCVVGLPDGAMLVKILKPAPDGRFHLISNGVEETMFDQEVAWAARVKDVRPG